jgi:hypothetical protein
LLAREHAGFAESQVTEFRSVAELAVVAVGIGLALGIDAHVELFVADVVADAWTVVGPANIIGAVAFLLAVTENAVVALEIFAANGANAYLGVLPAGLVTPAGFQAQLAEARHAPFAAITKDVVVAVGIVTARDGIALIGLLDAELRVSAWRPSVTANATAAGLAAVTVLAVVAFSVDGALGIGANVDLLDADVVSHAGSTVQVGLALTAGVA